MRLLGLFSDDGELGATYCGIRTPPRFPCQTGRPTSFNCHGTYRRRNKQDLWERNPVAVLDEWTFPKITETTVSVFKHVGVVLGPTINVPPPTPDLWRPAT